MGADYFRVFRAEQDFNRPTNKKLCIKWDKSNPGVSYNVSSVIEYYIMFPQIWANFKS